MTILRISTPGSQDRLAQIGEGSFTLGSDFGCDFALIDDGIAARHLTFEVGEQGVLVGLAGESPAALIDQNGNRTPMVQGQSYPLFLGASVALAGVSVTAAGPKVRIAPAEPSGLARLAQRTMAISGRSLRNSMIGLGTLVATGMVAAGVLDLVSVQASAPKPTVKPTAQAPQLAGVVPSLDAHLAALGLDDADFVEDPQGTQRVIHVRTVAERAVLAEALREMPFPGETTIVAEDRLRSAVQTILAASDGQAKLVALDRGKLVLSGLTEDPDRRARMIEVIRADISGITEVTFEDPIVSPADELAREIVAVWPGPHPYVVLADGRRLREGEAVTEGLTVHGISADGLITLQLDDKTHEIRLPK